MRRTMTSQKFFPLLTTFVVVLRMVGLPGKGRNTPTTRARSQQATMAATMAATQTGNAYLDSLNRRLNQTYDTSKFKKAGPYKLALASQGPTNSWATLFDAHAR